jgi:PIN domain nuclease of toxin-antitoxin system
LLDTNALLWTIGDRSRIRPDALAAIEAPTNLVAVSPVSPWEIEIKRALGKLRAPNDLGQQLERAGFVPLPITVAHGLAAGALPLHHRDPFDRMLVAQAQLEGMTIVTRDRDIARYQVAILPA